MIRIAEIRCGIISAILIGYPNWRITKFHNTRGEIPGLNFAEDGMSGNGVIGSMDFRGDLRQNQLPHLSIMLLSFFILLLSTELLLGGQYYQNGEVGIGQAQFFTDISISNIEFRNQFAVVDGWATFMVSGEYRKFQNSFGPHIPGAFAEEMNRALALLSQMGYYTVDIALYQGDRTIQGYRRGSTGGWVIEGRRNRVEEEEARRKAAENAARQQQRATEKRSNINRGSSSSRVQGNRSCEAYLYSSIYKPDYRLESYIDVAGEYINVAWGTTEIYQNEPYRVDLYIENRSGQKRALKPGQNWVDPGRYRVFIEFYGVRSTSVSVKYKCK